MSSMFIKLDMDHPDIAGLTYVGNDGVKIKKLTFVSDLIEKILKPLSSGKTRLPRFPEGTVDVLYEDEGTYMVTFLVPAQILPVTYHDEGTVMQVGHPSLLLALSVKNGKHVGSRIFAVKETEPSMIQDDSKLFRYPYGNVYHDGKICWGSNSFKEMLTPDKARGVFAKFAASVMNTDLYGPDNTALKLSLPELLDTFRDKQFDNSILKATGKYGDLFKED